MTTESFDRQLGRWLEQDAPGRVPDHLTEVLVATRATRQRPAWLSPERWLPVDTTFRPLPFAPGRAGRMAIILIALLVAAAATYLVAGALQSRVPAPFGLARNGVMGYWSDGDIFVADPDGSNPRLLIGGPERDYAPWFSRDGTQLIFVRGTPAAESLMLASADGSGIRPITEPLAGLDWFEWSPEDDAIAIVHTDESARRVLSLVDPSGASPLRTFNLPFDVDNAVYWRPPDGRELILTGRAGDSGVPRVYAVSLDGAVRLLAESARPAPYEELVLAPDGRTAWHGGFEPQSDPSIDTLAARLYRLDLETGISTAVHFGAVPAFFSHEVSPDGTRVAFVTDCVHEGCAGADPAQVMVAPLEGGAPFFVGQPFDFAGAPTLNWSPDGTLLAIDNLPRRNRAVPVTTDRPAWLLRTDRAGEMTRIDDGFIGWQRLAR
jgi:Tol biopolymer transport system component